MSWLTHIVRCNNADLGRYRRLEIAGSAVGHVRIDRVARLLALDGFEAAGDGVRLAPAEPADRDAALAAAAETLAAEGAIQALRGELYAVRPSWGAPLIARLDRAAAPWFGIRTWGVHMNGYVRRADGLHLWIARRARDKPTYPGELDNTVAGGLPADLDPFENLVKECAEEASIPAALARQARPVGVISYVYEEPGGVKPDQQFCWDLELPSDFVPENADGEIEAFMLMPVAEVMALVRDTTELKFNCALALIDFFLRHGLIGPDDPDYTALCHGLRRGRP